MVGTTFVTLTKLVEKSHFQGAHISTRIHLLTVQTRYPLAARHSAYPVSSLLYSLERLWVLITSMAVQLLFWCIQSSTGALLRLPTINPKAPKPAERAWQNGIAEQRGWQMLVLWLPQYPSPQLKSQTNSTGKKDALQHIMLRHFRAGQIDSLTLTF